MILRSNLRIMFMLFLFLGANWVLIDLLPRERTDLRHRTLMEYFAANTSHGSGRTTCSAQCA